MRWWRSKPISSVPRCRVPSTRVADFGILLGLALEQPAVLVEQRTEPRPRQAARAAAVVGEIGAEPVALIGDGQQALARRLHDERRPAAEVARPMSSAPGRRGTRAGRSASPRAGRARNARSAGPRSRCAPSALAADRRPWSILGQHAGHGHRSGGRPDQQPAQHRPAVETERPARVSHDGSRPLGDAPRHKRETLPRTRSHCSLRRAEGGGTALAARAAPPRTAPPACRSWRRRARTDR